MSDTITFALPKGRIMQDSMELFGKIGITCPEMEEDNRKLVFENREAGYRFMAVRATDVPTYVEYGCADIGVVGKDTLLEQGKDHQKKQKKKKKKKKNQKKKKKKKQHKKDPANWSNIRVATKYPNVTEKFFAGKGVQVELIKLYGSIELAPLVGLSERIVDLVSTGATLRDNGMVEVETIAEITTRLIVNRASLKTKHKRIAKIIDDLEKVIGDDVKISG